MPDEIMATVMGLGVTAIVIVAFIVTFIVIFKKSRTQKTQANHAERSKQNDVAANKQVELTAEQKAKLQEIREFHKQRLEEEKHERHQEDAREHGHAGVEEHYEEIVGSLGVVNDEGCEDLNGVRFVASDLSYEIGEEEQSDFGKLAQAMVLGEVLNNPRFKKPYSRK